MSAALDQEVPQVPSAAAAGRIEGYLGALWLAVGMGSGLAGIPIQFLLKDRMRQSPDAVAIFGAVTALPLYLGFLFGFLRDRQVLRLGDRGNLLVAAPIAVLVWAVIGLVPTTYSGLLAGILIATILSQVLFTAVQSLTTAVAQHRLMSGRLGAVSVIGQTAPAAAAAWAGGWLVSRVEARGVFFLTASAFGLLFLLSLLKPKAVYSAVPEHPSRNELTWSAVRRLVTHRPLWPAAAIMFLWNFSPGFQTPLFFHFTDHLKISAETFGQFSALSSITFVPTAFVYGIACKRWPLRPLLWWGTLFAVVQILPVIWCRTPVHVLLFGAGVGLLGGFASSAYLDLVIRACPSGLEGTGSMLAISAMAIAIRAGDLFGTWLYGRGGFMAAIFTTTAVYCCIAPLLLIVPRSLTSSRDGELQGAGQQSAESGERLSE